MDTQLEQPSFVEKGVTHVFRESKGRGNGKIFWGLCPQTPSYLVNRSENRPGSAPGDGQTSQFLLKNMCTEWSPPKGISLPKNLVRLWRKSFCFQEKSAKNLVRFFETMKCPSVSAIIFARFSVSDWSSQNSGWCSLVFLSF